MPLGLLCLPSRSSLGQHAVNEPTFQRLFTSGVVLSEARASKWFSSSTGRIREDVFCATSVQQCRLPPSVPAAEVTEDQTSQTYTHLYSFFTWKEPNHTHREQVSKQTATFFKPIEQFSFTEKKQSRPKLHTSKQTSNLFNLHYSNDAWSTTQRKYTQNHFL